MNGRYVLDEEGNPVVEPDLMKWARWFQTADRRVAHDEIGDSRISTVFLGLDHSFDPDGPPLLYETLVFGGPLNEEMERYPTRDAALAGHKDMVGRVRAILADKVEPAT